MMREIGAVRPESYASRNAASPIASRDTREVSILDSRKRDLARGSQTLKQGVGGSVQPGRSLRPAGGGVDHREGLQAPADATPIAKAPTERQGLVRTRLRLVKTILDDAERRKIRQDDAECPHLAGLPQEGDRLLERLPRLIQFAGLERRVREHA